MSAAGDAVCEDARHEQDEAAAAESMLQKLAASVFHRKQQREDRRVAQVEEQDPRENIQAFLSNFRSCHGAAESQLQALVSQGAVSAAQAPAATAALSALATALADLETSLATASYFLPSFDQKHCAKQVQLETAKVDLLPRRKFTFSNKVARVRGEEAAVRPQALPIPDSQCPNSHPADCTAIRSHCSQTPHSTQQGLPARAARQVCTDRDLANIALGRGLQGHTNQSLVRGSAELCGQDFVVTDCQGCTIILHGHIGALRLLNLRDCTVVAGPVTGATLIDEVQGSTLMLATYQARIHRAVDSDVYLRVRSRPIVEHCMGLRFAPYPHCVAKEHQALLSAHLLGEELGLWQSVDDFGWIKAVQSPHWVVLPEHERRQLPSMPKLNYKS